MVLFPLLFTLTASGADLSPAEQALTERISARSLEGHLSFIASDALAGRDTPSAGLDIASEYIAAQFRRAGLKPLPDGTYFQTAALAIQEQKLDTFSLTLENGKQITRGIRLDVRISGSSPLNVMHAPVYHGKGFEGVDAGAIDGKAVIVTIDGSAGDGEEQQMAVVFRALRDARALLRKSKPAALVVVTPSLPPALGPDRRVIDPETAQSGEAPVILIASPDWRANTALLPAGSSSATLSAYLEAPIMTQAKARNVIGLLPGSDPQLKNTYVVVSAHYDHLGVRAGGGDAVYNGANDDGSGVVSVIELASALGAMDPAPKRSVIFMTYFGEEKGLLGSRYYGRHPAYPLKQTVADLNLEQVGRTDEEGGPQTNSASVTGFDFSSVTDYLVRAGEKTGIRVYKNPAASDPFFARSDNQALADAGVPAHTVCTAFEFADYHKPSDEWTKVDYNNMSKVDRMIAVAVEMMANSPQAPEWNASNEKTSKYVEASKKLKSE